MMSAAGDDGLTRSSQNHQLSCVGVERFGQCHQGESMSNMFQHQLGFEPHGYSIENAGPSLPRGAGLKQDFISLGQGFSDMGRYISKSVAFLTFASVVRAVVD